MAIKPVSGEIKSQDINDNLSYLDNKLSQVNGGPLGVLKSENELNQKYPNGANGFFVVLDADDKTGYMYTWDGKKWVKGALYQSMGIADNSVSLSKIKKELLSPKYIVRNGATPTYTYDLNNGDILKLSNEDTDLITWGSNFYWVPVNTVVIGDTAELGDSSITKLVLNIETKELKLVAYSTANLTNEMSIAVFNRREKGMYIDQSGFKCIMNGVQPVETMLPFAKWQSNSKANSYIIDYVSKTLTFKTDVSVYVGDKTYVNAIKKNSVLDLTLPFDSTTSWTFLLFNIKTKELRIEEYQKINEYTTGDWAMISTINRVGAAGVNSFIRIIDDLPMNRPYNTSSTKLIPALNGRFVVDRNNSKLIFKSDRWDSIINTEFGPQVSILIDGMTIQIPNQDSEPSSALNLWYDIRKKIFIFLPYSYSMTNIDDKTLQWFGSIRRVSNNDGKLIEFTAILPIPWEIDGKLYGMYGNRTENKINYPYICLDAPIKCIHHRGLSRKYPENTLRAYRESKLIGVNEVEMDLAWTNDNVPVNLHDTTINRTARNNDGSVLDINLDISDLNLVDVKKYDFGIWKSLVFKGEKIPTFEECLRQCKQLDQRLHIDRSYNLDESRLKIIKEIIDRVDYYNVVFYIMNEAKATLIRSVFPDATLSILTFSDVLESHIRLAKEFDSKTAVCTINAQANLLTQDGVKSALKENVKVWCWNADSIDRQMLIDWGVTGIATDFANIQYEILNEN